MEVRNGSIGIVTDIDPEKAMVKVNWPETNVVSPWLQILTFEGFYVIPAVNDQVLCMYDQFRETGVMIGTVMAEGEVPFNDADVLGIKFAGIEIQIKKSSGETTVISSGKVSVKADSVEIEADSVKISKDLEVGGKTVLKDDLTAQKKIDATGEISSQQIITSAVDVQGGLIKLSTHTHNVTGIGAPTGPSLPT